MRFRLYTLAAIFSALAAFSNGIAIKYSLYWVFSWFDVIVHVLASIMVYLVSYAILSHRYETKKALWLALLATCTVGVLWEVFEYESGATRFEPGLISDTIYDILCDIGGGVVGALLSWKITKSAKTSV